MKQILLLPLLFSFLHSFAGTVTGTVTSQNGAVLPFASVSVKGTNKGVLANSAGKYTLLLGDGEYTLVCRHVGYKSEEKKVNVGREAGVVDFRLADQELQMAEVVIKRGEDPALEIMRRTIAKREFYNRQTDSLTVDVYIKGLLRSREVPDKIFGQKIEKGDFKKDGLDSTGRGILFLSESLTKVSYKRPDKIKYEVVSSRESGGGLGLSFPFFINFYTNNVQLFSNNVNPRGFVSPVADGAFRYYTFRFEGSFFEGGKMIDRIRVTPRRKQEPLFDGYLQIVDEEWRIHSLNLMTTKEQGLDLLDTIRVTQTHAEVEPNVYKTSHQVLSLAAKFFGFAVAGDFLNQYSNYNLNPGFQKGFFNRILMKYDTAANKRDSAYWSRLRPVPLEAEERQNFVFKDSVARADRDPAFSRRSLDSLRRAQKPVKAKQFVLGGAERTFYARRASLAYRFQPLLPENIRYNTVEGVVAVIGQTLGYRPRQSRNVFLLNTEARYGFGNRHLNAFGELTVQARRPGFTNRYWRFTGGKRLLQFNRDNPISETVNTVSTLFYNRNYLKVYEAWTGKAEYNNRFENGLRLNVTAAYEDRLPVANTTDFSFFKTRRTILPNHPYELAGVPFTRHAAFVTAVALSYQPGQRYIQFPSRKVPVGSNLPTFELQYRKGIPDLFNSTADFDAWRFSVSDEANLKLWGTLHYRLSAGGFLNRRRVDIPDFTHFNGNQTIVAAPYLNSFQLAPYYRYSNTEKLYGVLHAEHHFNGLLTNKFPLFNKLKWNLVAGTNSFYVNRSNYYVEAFAGLENIFKILRIDFVTTAQAEPANRFGVRLGFGGVLGGSIRVNRRSASASIAL